MCIRVRISGRYACWTPVGCRSERATATLPGHDAWRGQLRKLLHKRAMDYVIGKVTLLSEPTRKPITSNEFKFNSVGLGPVFAHQGQHTQRTTVYISKPDYLVEFEIRLTKDARPEDTLAKYEAMFLRRVKKGQQERSPVLGITECPARIDLVTDDMLGDLPQPPNWNEDLGISFFGTDWDAGLYYFYALEIVCGVLVYPTWEEVRRVAITRPLRRVA